MIQFKPEDAISGDSKSPKFVTDKVADTTPVKDFLQGKYCLYGGELLVGSKGGFTVFFQELVGGNLSFVTAKV